MKIHKCPALLFLFVLSLLFIACQESTGQQGKTAEATRANPSAILHRWRLDMPTAKRQMAGFRDAVVQITKEVQPGSESKVRQVLEPRLAAWIEESKNTWHEFRADGTRLYAESGKSGKGRYRLSARQDSLYLLTADGRKVEDFGIVSLSDTALIVTHNIAIPMLDRTDKRFHQMTVKFVR